MAPIKCCVLGCSSTTQTHQLYNLPKDDKLRALWMSFLVPVNSQLLGLSKAQLLNKRVCQKHFDRHQLNEKGNRLRFGYPSLFSTEEIEYGMPLSGDNNDHNYSKKEDFEEMTEEDPLVAQEHPVDHQYLRPASPASSFLSNDFTTVVFESSEMPPINECEESLHDIQIDSLESLHDTQIDFLEPQGIESDQNLLSDSSGSVHLQLKPSFGSDHLQPKPSFGSNHLHPNPSFGSDHLQPKPCLQSDHLEPKPSFGLDHLKPKPSFGSDHLQPKPSFGSDHLQPKPSFGSDHLQPKPSFGSNHLQPKPSFGSDHLQPKPSFGSDHLQPKPSFGSDHLQPKPSFIERYRFRRRIQKPDESIMQYISELEAMTIFCDFKAVLKEHLRDQLVYGLRSEQIRRRLFAEESLDYEKAVEIACAVEAAETDAGEVEQTLGRDAESGGGEVATRVLHGDSGDRQRGFANGTSYICLVCGSADHWGYGREHSRFFCGIRKQKGNLNRACPEGGQQGRCDTDNMESRRLQGRCDTDIMGSRQLKGRCDTDNLESRQLQDRCDTDNMGSRQLQGRFDTDNMGCRQLKGRCDTDNIESRQLQGRCDTDDKGAHAPAASGVTGQLDLVDQLDSYLHPSSDKENWKTEEDFQQLSRKGYKRLVIWVEEAQLPMDIDMESIVSCIRKTR